jgi:hypothetical protein
MGDGTSGRLDDDVCMDLTQMTPSEIDTEWLALEVSLSSCAQRIAAAQKTIDRYDGDTFTVYQGYADAAKDKAQAASDERVMLIAALKPYEAEYKARGGWNRAYLCMANGGHIHKSTACATLHITTQIAFLPEQSGLEEDEIVALAGIQACTVCYPTAPVDALKAALAADKAKTECPGSRTRDHDSSGLRYHSKRAKCNHCGQTISVTSAYNLRAHKPADKEAS